MIDLLKMSKAWLRSGKAKFLILMVLLVDIFLQNFFREGCRGVFNKGVSFGLLPGWGGQLATGFYLVFVFWFLFSLKQNKGKLWLMSLALGGLGNLIPRLFWGGVWDYLYFPVLAFWFNLSDVLITYGVLTYLWSEIATSSTPRNDKLY